MNFVHNLRSLNKGLKWVILVAATGSAWTILGGLLAGFFPALLAGLAAYWALFDFKRNQE